MTARDDKFRDISLGPLPNGISDRTRNFIVAAGMVGSSVMMPNDSTLITAFSVENPSSDSFIDSYLADTKDKGSYMLDVIQEPREKDLYAMMCSVDKGLAKDIRTHILTHGNVFVRGRGEYPAYDKICEKLLNIESDTLDFDPKTKSLSDVFQAALDHFNLDGQAVSTKDVTPLKDNVGVDGSIFEEESTF